MTITHSPLALWTFGFTLCSHSLFNCLTHRGCLIFLSRIVPSAANLSCSSFRAVTAMLSLICIEYATLFSFNSRFYLLLLSQPSLLRLSHRPRKGILSSAFISPLAQRTRLLLVFLPSHIVFGRVFLLNYLCMARFKVNRELHISLFIFRKS